MSDLGDRMDALAKAFDEGIAEGLRIGAENVKFAFGDALAMAPRVMTLEEVCALEDDTVVWLEDNDKTDVIPAVVNHAWNSLTNIVSFALKNMREVKADMLWYRLKWRCWTSRPDQATREAIPW